MEKASFKSIAVVLRPKTSSDFSSVLINLRNWLSKRKITINFLEKEREVVTKIFNNIPKDISFIKENKLHSSSDLIVTLGGDGTFIGAARHSTRSSPPILGVNMGKLGFITEFSKAELFDALNDILRGDYRGEKINLFKVEVEGLKTAKIQSFFLNDAVVSKPDISRMFRLSIEADDEHIYNLSGDGLIVSSPTGSTAYSLAAGGPIVNPKVNAMALTPICPHGLTHRPLVISDTSKVVVKVPKESGAVTLTLDGQEVISLEPRSIISISKAANRGGKIIKNPARTYFHTLAVKFSHGRK